MSEQGYDLVVVGGGPGGYVAAIRAAQLGMKVACVEKRGSLGGTCLNVGCIPSKALLHSSERFAEARDHLGAQGIKISKLDLDLKTMMARKDKVVNDLTKGVEFLFKKNKIDYVKGWGEIVSATEVKVGEQTLKTKNIVIATGSEPASLPGVEVDETRVVTSTGALELKSVPKHLAVIGAGVIGLELGSVWARLGAQVTVIEFLDRILPGMDAEICKQTQRILAKQGLAFKLGHKVTAAKSTKTSVSLTVEPVKGGDAETVTADIVLVSIGRRPYTEGLGLGALGVEIDNRGVIQVDDRFQTSVPGVYAVGDCAGKQLLAHKAMHEGVICVEAIAGQGHGTVDYQNVPNCTYCNPEVASVGLTEEQAREQGLEIDIGKFPWVGNGRALAAGHSEGFVKVIRGAQYSEILGAHIVGAHATELIGEFVVGRHLESTVEEMDRAMHPHPTLSEAIAEGALSALGRAIHI